VLGAGAAGGAADFAAAAALALLRAVDALEPDAAFPGFRGRRFVPRSNTGKLALHGSSFVPPQLLATLAALLATRGAGADIVAGNAALCNALLSSTHALVARSDWAGQPVPFVGVVYAQLVSLPARCWLDEAGRVLWRGERWSKMFDAPLGQGWVITLSSMLPLAQPRWMRGGATSCWSACTWGRSAYPTWAAAAPAPPCLFCLALLTLFFPHHYHAQ